MQFAMHETMIFDMNRYRPPQGSVMRYTVAYFDALGRVVATGSHELWPVACEHAARELASYMQTANYSAPFTRSIQLTLD